jgi:4-hydroxy-tetrahydrodipicolinate synthase
VKTSEVTIADLKASVLAVPPLATAADGSPSEAENRKIVAFLTAGGVTTLLYGGNANLYNLSLTAFPGLLDMLERIAPEASWVIPSIGPDFGKAMDQVAVARGHAFPTLMVLPSTGATSPAGVATGMRRLADAFGRPLIAYLRADGYIRPVDIAALFADGAISALKYAVVRRDPSDDAYLRAIVEAAGAERIVSGIGERPAVAHFRDFGLSSFTSGSVCVAPHLSTAILTALKRGDSATAEALRARFLPLEDLRDAHSPIAVLHEAVRLVGVAETGALQPFLSNLAVERHDEVGRVAQALFAENAAHAQSAAA